MRVAAGNIMSRVRRKAAGREGASFAVALLFALVVAFVAAASISSASVNAERATAANRADEQGYYAVASALETASDLVERDVCTSFSIEVASDGTATATGGSDPLGLREWARAQVEAVARGGTAVPKNMVVRASGMGDAEVPDVLVTFTMADNGIFMRACVDVWGSSDVPADAAALEADLVERADYARFLTKQAAYGAGLGGSLPATVTWNPLPSDLSPGEGGA